MTPEHAKQGAIDVLDDEGGYGRCVLNAFVLGCDVQERD